MKTKQKIFQINKKKQVDNIIKNNLTFNKKQIQPKSKHHEILKKQNLTLNI